MISIIIPTYNEEKRIGDLIRYLLTQASGIKVELIVVDGGSSDETASVAEKAGARVVESPKKGRAAQMNYGASIASEKWLYFLHADTTPPVNYIALIKEQIDKSSQSGCFQLRFSSDHPILRFYAWFTRFDLNILRFGDQSLFVKASHFNEIKGFDTSLIVMEDQEIIHRLKQKGPFSIINEPVKTSARKYERHGVYQLQFIFSMILIMYYLGVDQRTLEHFYNDFLKE